ncbi:hypothetical protein SELMODRAFT_420026 [Selaginella moellendorffii]|uniref:Uncharacterized protein n=1 Tax=Selaginella moellendorffii TaxID=88036 RepID=D8SAB3_SELML|nr:hypothetical protein SELMODRAFT_420026 [Selaginella moellendorffii]
MGGAEEAESDEFYELTPEDYARLVSKKRKERFLKTAKSRDAEAAARRSKFAKATLRVRFLDSIMMVFGSHCSPGLKFIGLLASIQRWNASASVPSGRVFQGGYINVDGDVIDHEGTVNLQMLSAANIIDMYA